ncbi:MAG: histidine kinase [Thermomicrobiales bacterium]|nr:histidine kinase [Thermomicrobiales bacterium]
MVAWTLEDMLADLGCEVVGPAARVDQALAMIEAVAVDAAVLDVNLNGERSYPVADALAARGVPFVFSTGYNKNSLHAGYLGFPMLQKPFERSQLGDALARLLTPGILPTPGQKTSPSVWDANRLRIATDAAGVALWSWNVDTDEIALDERAHGLWGVDVEAATFEDLSARIHPEDLDRVRAAFAATREIFGAYEIDFRILHGAEVRWVSARGRGDDQGIVGRMMFGVFLDVTERKLAEEAREMIANEMAHRVKNLFAIASALTGISARSTATTAEMYRDLTQRLAALSRAHDLVRPVLSQPKEAAVLGELLAVLLGPYDDEGAIGARVQVCVPDLLVGEASATTLALVVHELATNSIKYGSLSRESGTVAVSCTAQDSEVVIIWTETGGPPIRASNKPSGFGSQLVTRSVSSQLGGTIAFDWPTEGVVVTLRMSKARLGA